MQKNTRKIIVKLNHFAFKTAIILLGFSIITLKNAIAADSCTCTAPYYNYATIYEAFADTSRCCRGYKIERNISLSRSLTTSGPYSNVTVVGNYFSIKPSELFDASYAFLNDNTQKFLNIDHVGRHYNGAEGSAGFTGFSGTIINNTGTTTIESSVFNDNTLNKSGDTSFVWNKGKLILNNVLVINNTTHIGSKAFFHNTGSGEIYINNSYFTNNGTVNKYLIYNSKSTNKLSIKNSVFKDNDADIISGASGANYMFDISDSDFSGNNNSMVYIKKGKANITNCNFTNGSGIYYTGGTLNIYSTTKDSSIYKIEGTSSTDQVNIYSTRSVTVENTNSGLNINQTIDNTDYTGNVIIGQISATDNTLKKAVTVHNGYVEFTGYASMHRLILDSHPATCKFSYTHTNGQDVKIESLEINSSNNVFDFQNNAIQDHIELADQTNVAPGEDPEGELKINANVELRIDVDLANRQSDYFYADTLSSLISGSGKFVINDIKIIGQAAEKTTIVRVADANLASRFLLNVNVVDSGREIYFISYDNGYLTFEKNSDITRHTCVRTPSSCEDLGFTDTEYLGKDFCSPCPTNGSFFRCLPN